MADMADDDFAARAAQLAAADVERELITASRSYEDAVREGDELGAAVALRDYAAVKRTYDTLTGRDQPQQQQASGQLSNAQRNFLSRRQAGGDQLNAQRMQDYHNGHLKAVAAGLRVDSPEYFSAIENYADHLGDGRQPPLNEREAARLCGIDEQTYAANAARLRAMRAAGQHD